jgi:hypothetical protein
LNSARATVLEPAKTTLATSSLLSPLLIIANSKVQWFNKLV